MFPSESPCPARHLPCSFYQNRVPPLVSNQPSHRRNFSFVLCLLVHYILAIRWRFTLLAFFVSCLQDSQELCLCRGLFMLRTVYVWKLIRIFLHISQVYKHTMDHPVSCNYGSLCILCLWITLYSFLNPKSFGWSVCCSRKCWTIFVHYLFQRVVAMCDIRWGLFASMRLGRCALSKYRSSLSISGDSQVSSKLKPDQG